MTNGVGGRICAPLSEFLRVVRRARTARDARDTSMERFFGTLPDVADPMPRLQFPSVFSTDQYLRQGDRADWSYTDPRIQLFAGLLLRRLRQIEVPFFVHCAYRSNDEQLRLYDLGRTTIKTSGAHGRGAAVDLVHSRYAWDLSRQEWSFIGKIGKDIARKAGIPIEWGGDWSFYDPAHWQLPEWRSMVAHSRSPEPLRLTPFNLVQFNKHLLP